MDEGPVPCPFLKFDLDEKNKVAELCSIIERDAYELKMY
jgi:hypothetical protein